MKNLKGFYLLGAVGAGIGIALALTNPGSSAYNEYATQRLSEYLQADLCPQAGSFLKGSCQSLIQDNQKAIGSIVAKNTRREDYLLWSVYKTDLAIDSMLPSLLKDVLQESLPAYHAETIGVFNTLHTYQLKRH
jgi:hypothetical protein